MFCFLKQDEGQRVAIQQNNMPDTTPEEKKRGGEDRRKKEGGKDKMSQTKKKRNRKTRKSKVIIIDEGNGTVMFRMRMSHGRLLERCQAFLHRLVLPHFYWNM